MTNDHFKHEKFQFNPDTMFLTRNEYHEDCRLEEIFLIVGANNLFIKRAKSIKLFPKNQSKEDTPIVLLTPDEILEENLEYVLKKYNTSIFLASEDELIGWSNVTDREWISIIEKLVPRKSQRRLIKDYINRIKNGVNKTKGELISNGYKFNEYNKLEFERELELLKERQEFISELEMKKVNKTELDSSCYYSEKRNKEFENTKSQNSIELKSYQELKSNILKKNNINSYEYELSEIIIESLETYLKKNFLLERLNFKIHSIGETIRNRKYQNKF